MTTDAKRESKKRFLATDKGKFGEVLAQAKRRAVAKGLPFALTWEDLDPIPDVCPVLGIPVFRGTSKACDNSPSLDKIKPELGYVPGNVRWISNKANRLKSDMTADEIRLVYEDALRLGY